MSPQYRVGLDDPSQLSSRRVRRRAPNFMVDALATDRLVPDANRSQSAGDDCTVDRITCVSAWNKGSDAFPMIRVRRRQSTVLAEGRP